MKTYWANDGNDTVGAGGVLKTCFHGNYSKMLKAEKELGIGLTKGTETNKALSDLGLIVSDLVKNYFSQSFR